MAVALTAQGISASGYSSRRRQLVSLVDRLRSAGASTEIDLPRIAVIGNQSAGKSSLVEAISGVRSERPVSPLARSHGLTRTSVRIKVPRDAGTCTRCPMEIRLRSSKQPWTCRIALRFETDPEGRPIETVRELAFGEPMQDPNQVEGLLRRAQLAILNQRVAMKDLDYFINLPKKVVLDAKAGSLPEDLAMQQSFSTNLICVEVSGPEITDLAFLDLPGIISNADDTRDIQLIEDMVRKSVGGNTLILLTVTMKDDFQNQKAVLMAKEADPEGKRTIGVLTKADTVQRGEHASWLELVEGRRHQLAHGFFVTKQPGTEDLAKNLSFQEARAAEVDFFKSEEPWDNLAPHVRRQLGTGHLVAFLSDRLARYISEKLPQIRTDLATSLATVQAALKDLPPPPSADPIAELHARLAALGRDLDLLVQGASGHADLVQSKNREDQRYKVNIRATRPHFIPFTKAEKEKSARLAWETKHPLNEKAGVEALAMDLDELHRHIEEHKGREVPLNTSYGAKASLMIKSMASWPDLSAELLDQMRRSVNACVNKLIRRRFQSTDAELFGITTMVASEVLETLFAKASTRISEYLELEHTPFTLNDHYFSQTRDDIMTALKSAREHPEPFTFGSDAEAVRQQKQQRLTEALAALAACGYPGVKAHQLPRLLGPDVHEEVLDAAAQTVAYWKIAYKRIIDTVPRIIDSAIIRPLPTSVGEALLKRVVSNGEEEVRRLMAEPAALADERAELNMRKNRLEEARKVLASFGRSLE